ncbi:MAG: hypothetical protein ACK58T_38030, partial [Phycisphaerae bacterium]|jgi:hypothetical protein
MLSFLIDPNGVLLFWDTEFSSGDHESRFGDEKKMASGFHVRRSALRGAMSGHFVYGWPSLSQ